jgi:hypothetical protein
MDDFLIEASVAIGVSQVELENGYYMIDLPAVLESKRKQSALERLTDVHIILATNNRNLEEAEYKAFIRRLNKDVGIKEEQSFNRDKFEELRMFAKG